MQIRRWPLTGMILRPRSYSPSIQSAKFIHQQMQMFRKRYHNKWKRNLFCYNTPFTASDLLGYDARNSFCIFFCGSFWLSYVETGSDTREQREWDHRDFKLQLMSSAAHKTMAPTGIQFSCIMFPPSIYTKGSLSICQYFFRMKPILNVKAGMHYTTDFCPGFSLDESTL